MPSVRVLLLPRCLVHTGDWTEEVVEEEVTTSALPLLVCLLVVGAMTGLGTGTQAESEAVEVWAVVSTAWQVEAGAGLGFEIGVRKEETEILVWIPLRVVETGTEELEAALALEAALNLFPFFGGMLAP